MREARQHRARLPRTRGARTRRVGRARSAQGGTMTTKPSYDTPFYPLFNGVTTPTAHACWIVLSMAGTPQGWNDRDVLVGRTRADQVALFEIAADAVAAGRRDLGEGQYRVRKARLILGIELMPGDEDE